MNQPIRELYAVTFRFLVTSNKLVPGPLITKSGCLTEFKKKGEGSQIYHIFYMFVRWDLFILSSDTTGVILSILLNFKQTNGPAFYISIDLAL